MRRLPRGQDARRVQAKLREWSRSGAVVRDAQPEAWPPGHFYSPIPSLQDVRRDEQRLFAAPPRQIPGIELRESEQLALFSELARYYPDQPWSDGESAGLRYYFENDYFRHGEAIVLFCLLRHLQLRRVVEIGSGFSSSAILDTNERIFDSAIACIFVEPYPDVLLSRLKPADLASVTLLRERVQDVELGIFSALERGDISIF